MSRDHNWQFDLEEYIRQGETEQAEKSTAQKTAIGLQDVDGLQTSAYLLENLSLGHNNELKNRYLHVDHVSNRESAVQSANNTISKCKNCTLEESALLHAIEENPFATQKELARMIGKSEKQ